MTLLQHPPSGRGENFRPWKGDLVTRPNRLVHVITTLDPGGAENNLLALCRGLPHDRFDIRIVVLKGNAGLAPAFEEAGIPVCRLPMLGPADPTAPWRLAWKFSGWRPDIVHTHLFKGEVHGTLAAWLAGTPVCISTKHNEDQYLRSFPVRLLAHEIAALQHRTYAISEGVLRFTRDVGRLPAEQLRTMPYGIDSTPQGDRRSGRDLLAELCGVPPETRFLLTVARLAPQKGHDDLLTALSRLPPAPPVVAVFAGTGPLEGELRAQVARLGLESRVRFLGFRSDVPQLMAGCDALVLPSRWEGLGLVLLEAMRESRPVVASRVGGIPEVVVDGETGRLTPPGEVSALTAALREVLDNPKLAEAWGAAGRVRLEREFTLEKMCARWVREYESLLEDRGVNF